jgi:hypothetical protein
VLERELRLVVEKPSGHDEVAGNPFRAVGFQGLDLVLRRAVEFLARDILIDFGRTLTVRAVGAAEVAGVGNAGRAVLSPVAAELAGAGVAPVKAAGCAVLAGCPVLPVAERPAVVSATKAAAVAVALTARTVTKRLTVTITKRLTLTTTKAAAVTLALTARTITKRLTLTTTKTATIAVALTARTITKRLTLTTAKTATIAVALTGAEAPRIPAGVIGPPKRAPLPSPVASRVPPVISAAVTAALVLSHGGFLL